MKRLREPAKCLRQCRTVSKAETISAVSPFEYLPAMIVEKLRMRPVISARRHEQTSFRVDKPRHGVRNGAFGDEQAVVVIDRNQPPIVFRRGIFDADKGSTFRAG